MKDPQGGQILTAEQTIIDPKDGDTIVLTIDRAIQKEIETLLQAAIEKYQAESGQVIVMDPETGHVLAMVNAPLFDSNNYAVVYEKEPLFLNEGRENQIVVEVFHPDTNQRVVKAYRNDVFTPEGREFLSEKTREALTELETLYDLEDFARYYIYLGENNRREIFPHRRSRILPQVQEQHRCRSVLEQEHPGNLRAGLRHEADHDGHRPGSGRGDSDDIYDDTGPSKSTSTPSKTPCSPITGK